MIYDIEVFSAGVFVYKNNELFLKTIFPTSFGYCKCPIINPNNEVVLKYSLSTLFICNKYKIIENNLEEEIKLIRKGLYNQKLQVNKDLYETKFAFFSHETVNCCKIYLNEKKIADVKKKYWDFPPHKFEVRFNTENEQEQFFGLLELMVALTLFDDL